MKLAKYGVLVTFCSTLLSMGIEPNNPCLDGDIVPFIEQVESWEDKPYKDIADIDSMGYGFTKPFLRMWNLTFKDVDKETGKAIVLQYCLKVNHDILDKTNLTKQQRKAVFSFIYNVGEATYLKSTLHRYVSIRSLNDSQVTTELEKYVYAKGKYSKGLDNRRDKEVKFMKGEK